MTSRISQAIVEIVHSNDPNAYGRTSNFFLEVVTGPPSSENPGDPTQDGSIAEDDTGFDDTSATITLTRDTSSANRRTAFISFSPVDISQGAIIRSAELQIVGRSATNNDLYADFYGADADSVDTWNGSTNNPNNATLTTATTAVSEEDIIASAGDLAYIDVTAIIQEIIDRDGWVSGSSLAILAFSQTGTLKNFEFDSRNGTTPPALVIYFDVPAAAAAAGGGSRMTMIVQTQIMHNENKGGR